MKFMKSWAQLLTVVTVATVVLRHPPLPDAQTHSDCGKVDLAQTERNALLSKISARSHCRSNFPSTPSGLREYEAGPVVIDRTLWTAAEWLECLQSAVWLHLATPQSPQRGTQPPAFTQHRTVKVGAKPPLSAWEVC